MRGISQRSDDGSLSQRVAFEAARSRGGRSKSSGEKLVAAIEKATDSYSLDPADFGFFMTMLPVSLQRRFLNCVLKWVEFLSEKADKGLFFDTEEETLCQDARVVYQYTAFLRED